MQLKPFLKGFLEKQAFITLTNPSYLADQVREGKLTRYERENASQQLRTREWDRLLKGILFTGGGALLGGMAGSGLGKAFGYDPGPDANLFMKYLPTSVGSGVGGMLGRNLEMALLDPLDRMRYRDPKELEERLRESKLPLIAPSGRLLPEFVPPFSLPGGIKV